MTDLKQLAEVEIETTPEQKDSIQLSLSSIKETLPELDESTLLLISDSLSELTTEGYAQEDTQNLSILLERILNSPKDLPIIIGIFRIDEQSIIPFAMPNFWLIEDSPFHNVHQAYTWQLNGQPPYEITELKSKVQNLQIPFQFNSYLAYQKVAILSLNTSSPDVCNSFQVSFLYTLEQFLKSYLLHTSGINFQHSDITINELMLVPEKTSMLYAFIYKLSMRIDN